MAYTRDVISKTLDHCPVHVTIKPAVAVLKMPAIEPAVFASP